MGNLDELFEQDVPDSLQSELSPQAKTDMVKIAEAIKLAPITTMKYRQRDGFTDLSNWVVEKQGPTDTITLEGNSSGASYAKISKSPFDEDSCTSLLSNFVITGPFRLGLGMSLSQRIANQRCSMEFVECDQDGNLLSNVPAPQEISITSISQSTTTLAITTAVPHGLMPNDRVMVYNCPDSRMNYSEAIVATVPAYNQITIIATTYGSLPSLTIGAQTSGKIIKVDPFDLNNNALGIFWEGTSASNAKVISRGDKSSYLASPDTSFGSNNTVATTGSTSPLCDSFISTYQYDVKFKSEGVVVRSIPTNSLNSVGGTLKRSEVVPSIDRYYRIRLRAYTVKGATRPVCEIVSAVKSGTTTATITTDVAHNLVAGSFVQLYGMRDQVNFPNLTTATQVASIIDATHFTIVIGSAVTATSYGGSVILNNGSLNTSPLGFAIQSIARAGNLMTITLNNTASGVAIGETINLHGLYDTSGNPLNIYEGVYKVANVTGSTIVVYSSGADFGTINCGGAIYKRTDFRMHFLRAIDYTRFTADIDDGNGNMSDANAANPIAIASSNATMNQNIYQIAGSAAINGGVNGSFAVGGNTAHDSALAGNPVRIAGRAVTSNYTAVSTGDVADIPTTLVGVPIVKQYSIPDADFYIAAPVAGILNTTSALVVKEAPGAGLRNYYTSLDLFAEVLTNATELELRDTDLTVGTQTISSNTITTSVSHNLTVGDSVVFTSIGTGLTGITANTTYYVLTVPSSTTLTLSASRGGSVQSVSGTITVAATFHRVLWRTKIPTTGKQGIINFPSPLKGSVNTSQYLQTLTASGAGAVYVNAQGYVAP